MYQAKMDIRKGDRYYENQDYYNAAYAYKDALYNLKNYKQCCGKNELKDVMEQIHYVNYSIAWSYFWTEDNDEEAKKHINKALDYCETSSSYYVRGVLNKRSFKFYDALADFQKASILGEASGHNFDDEIATVYKLLDDYESAVKHYEIALEKKGKLDTFCFGRLIECSEKICDLRKAIKYYLIAKDIYPDDTFMLSEYDYLADLQGIMYNSKFEMELDVANKLFLNNNNDKAVIHYYNAVELDERSRISDREYERAATALKKALLQYDAIEYSCKMIKCLEEKNNINGIKYIAQSYHYLCEELDLDEDDKERYTDGISTDLDDFIFADEVDEEIDEEDNYGTISNDDNFDTEENKVENLLEELNSLIGLEGVKEEVNSLINLLRINKIRAQRGLNQVPMSLHLVFSGNPGTGKTTVARILAKIYKELGVLTTGQLVEVDRSKLVAGYVGQTAIQTQEKLQEAMGGILFIDEAYTLSSNKGDSDFGQEAIDVILKFMEDNRDDIVVIVAGYPDLMEEFLESNPGLRSRFNKYINFEDYKPVELTEIFKHMCQKAGYSINNDVEQYVMRLMENTFNNRSENFANAREVRNIFERAVTNQANRLVFDTELTNDQLMELTEQDVC